MPSTEPSSSASLRPIAWWVTHAAVALGLITGALQVGLSTPYMAPAGHGAGLAEASLLIGAED